MATIEIKDRSNKAVGEVTVDDSVFDGKVRRSLLHEAVVEYQARQRRGTHSTKTRSEVRGGGRKPWRQKGTGRARHGSIRSPHWRKGAVIFGPKPRDHGYRIGRRKQKRALQMALTVKRRDGQIVVLDELTIEEPKTKRVAELIGNLGLEGRVLIYDPEDSEQLRRAARNIPHVSVVSGYGLNVYDLFRHDWLLTSESGIERIGEALK